MFAAEQALSRQLVEPVNVPAEAPLKVTDVPLDAGDTMTDEGAAALAQNALFASMASARLRACSATSDSVCELCVPDKAVACIAAMPSTPIEMTTKATSTSKRLKPRCRIKETLIMDMVEDSWMRFVAMSP